MSNSDSAARLPTRVAFAVGRPVGAVAEVLRKSIPRRLRRHETQSLPGSPERSHIRIATRCDRRARREQSTPPRARRHQDGISLRASVKNGVPDATLSRDRFGQLQNRLRIYVDVNSDAPDTLAIGFLREGANLPDEWRKCDSRRLERDVLIRLVSIAKSDAPDCAGVVSWRACQLVFSRLRSPSSCLSAHPPLRKMRRHRGGMEDL